MTRRPGHNGRVRARRLALAVALSLPVSLAVPASALAHGIGGKTDLPVPAWLTAWAASVVLILSFVALATLWPAPRLESARSRAVLRFPRVLDPICGALGVALFGVVIYAALAGEQELPTANLAPTFIYAPFWVGLPILSLLFGDVFRAFNPWRAAARAVAWTVGKVGVARKPAGYPSWLGRWPAVAGILGFTWLELVYVEKDVPSKLAWLAIAYAAIQWIGMGLYGIDKWTSRGDAFAVYFNLFSRLSPLHWLRDRLELRPPLAGVSTLEPLAGTVPLLAAMIGSTSFDGLQQGSLWINSIEPELRSFFSNFGLGELAPEELSATVGLLGMVLLIGGFYRLGIRGMHSIDRSTSDRVLAARFAHTLVPIALAYVVAHYFSLLVYQDQAIWRLASDPLGNGSNIFGTAGGQIDFSVLTPNSIWYVQVAALLLGHIAGLTLAHDRALVLYRNARDAVRSQYWILV
ncbi:MAG: fenitrothion hydrolase, partial [Solirubrobacterales bacterium]|nr:fenitrothion hydrolase [Solirubrobacterales bacterium]